MVYRGRSQLRLCGLGCALAFLLAGPIAAAWSDEPPPNFKQLQRDYYKAYKAHDYQKALDILEKMHEARPKDVDTLYNLACVNCLLGNKDKAYSWLDEAVKAGFRDAELLADDFDFKTIRAEDRFRAIVKELRAQVRPPRPPADQPAPPEAAKADAETKPAKPEKPTKPEKSAKAEKPAAEEMSPTERQAKVLELTRKLIAAAGEGEYEKALKLALEAHKLADIGLTNYNVACMYSRLGKKDEAFKYLDRAIELGGFDTDLVRQIENDPDFANIRKDPRYSKALEKAGKPKAAAPPQKGEVDRRSGPPPGAVEEAKPVAFEWRVTLPKKYDASKKVPLIVALHDNDGNAENAAKQWAKAANEIGAILLTPQGTYSQQDGRFRWGHNVDEIEENVLGAIDDTLENCEVDEDRVVLAGYYEGGAAAWQILLRNPDAFRGIVAVASRFETPSDTVFKDPDLAKTCVYIVVGDDDDEQIVESNLEAARRFKEIGAKVTLLVYDGRAIQVWRTSSKQTVENQVEALRFVLGKK